MNYNYWGGRIAQRAYYDFLRDIAHLSKYNSGFKPIIRFSMFQFERDFAISFDKISFDELANSIRRILSKIN